MPSTTGTGPLTKSNAETKLAKAAAEVAGGAQKERSQEKETAAVGQQQQQQSGGNKTPPEQPEFIKQALIIIEKKVRNLEKRRQKLEEYKTMQRKNETLNEDQLNAVSRYDEVIRTLELSRELEKQFISLANDAMKQQKKQAKKEQTEREEAIKEKIKETQKYLTVLDVFGQENVRNDFLNEQNGAVKITQVELEVLDEFNKIARPTEISARLDAAATEAADHLVALVDAKGKPISGLVSSATGSPLTFTYSDLKKLFDRVLGAAYWTQQQQQPTQESVDQPADVQLHDQVVSDVHQQVEGQLEHHEQTAAMLNKLALHDEQLQLHQQHVVLEQVSSNDLSDKDKDASPNQLGQQSKTFFTTLNPADMQRNINEFITDDGINFLQDSEIQVQHQQQIQHQQHQQQQAYQQHQHVQQNEQQVQADGLQYQPQLIQQAQQMHPNMQSNNYGAQQQQQYVQMGQDFNDMSKDQGGYRGPRGAGNHQGGGGGGPRGPRPQRYDDRRGPRNGGSGGPPAQQGQGPRNPAGPYNGQRQSGGGGMNGGNGGVPQGSGGGGYRQNNYAQNRQGGGGGGSGNGGSYRGGNRGGNVPPRQGGYHQQQQPQAV